MITAHQNNQSQNILIKLNHFRKMILVEKNKKIINQKNQKRQNGQLIIIFHVNNTNVIKMHLKNIVVVMVVEMVIIIIKISIQKRLQF